MIHRRIPDTTTLPPPSVSFARFQNASLIMRNKNKKSCITMPSEVVESYNLQSIFITCYGMCVISCINKVKHDEEEKNECNGFQMLIT